MAQPGPAVHRVMRAPAGAGRREGAECRAGIFRGIEISAPPPGRERGSEQKPGHESGPEPGREPDPASDDALMLRYASGDYAAFETLYRRHKDAVYRYFLRQMDAASAADGHQDTWTRVIANRARYRAEGRFRAWLFAIAHNVLADRRRRSMRDAALYPATSAAVDEMAGGEASPERGAAGIEAAQKLDALIRRLPVAQREALIMHKESGLSLRQIAAVTGATEEGVKSRLRYAMEKLRAGMRDHV